MANKALILEVSQSGFDKYVAQNSHYASVLVEFMAVWARPCDVRANTLRDLATEFAGQFVFAKIDVDEQQELEERYAVRLPETTDSVAALSDKAAGHLLAMSQEWTA